MKRKSDRWVYSCLFQKRLLLRFKVTILIIVTEISVVTTENAYSKSTENPVAMEKKVILEGDLKTVTITGTDSQQNQVTGTVTDASTGEPMPGVNIIVKGTNIGTLTNIDGTYSLNVSDPNVVLTFSFIGYISQDIVLYGRTTVDVRLVPSIEALEEVVVVGYGIQNKKTLTGAISNVNSDVITRSITPTASGALVGKVAGITARQGDGRPGASTSLQIRNYGEPLYVIDGIPRTTADFDNIDIGNIESISILKDAAAAIYGLLAANGVVLVTTKLGKMNEKPTININGYYGLQGFTRFPQPANAYSYMLGLAESAQNRNTSTTITAQELENWKGGLYDPANGIDYRSFDYYDYVIKRNTPAPESYLNLSASGASDRARYYFSISQLDQKATIDEYYYKRYNIQANSEARLAKGLKVGTQINAYKEQRHTVGIPGGDDYVNIFASVMQNWPIERPYANDNPKYVNNTHSVNINPGMHKEEIMGWADDINRRFRGNIYSEYDFGFGLKAKATIAYGYSVYLVENQEYSAPVYTYDRATDSYNIVPGGGKTARYRATTRRNIEDIFGQLQLSYNKSFGKHTLSAVAAYERTKADNQYLFVKTTPPTNFIPIQALADVNILTNTWDMSARASYIGRVNYNFNDKYLVELLGRYDGSYLYDPSKRWGLFPGISLGWRISSEPFFKSLKGTISDLKIRVSYGETGSETGISAYDYLGGYNWGTGLYILDGTAFAGIASRGIPVTNLSWVTNSMKNIGFDFSLFNSKINGQFDLFERKVSGIPAARYDVLLPSEVGYTLPEENLNSRANRGIEGMVNYNSQIGKVNFTFGVNATLARERDIQTYKPRFGNSWDEYRNSIEDRWRYINWGYHIIGQFQNQQEINDYPVNLDDSGNRTLLPGDLIYDDLNGDNIINVLDQKPIGYARGQTPYMSFGLNNSFEFKGIYLFADFAGATMQSFIRTSALKEPFAVNGNSPDWLLEDRWHRADPFDANSEWIPGTNPPTRKDYSSHSNFNKTNDFYALNIKYMRMKSLEVGYTIQERLLKRTGISKLRIYTNISNIFSIDNIRKKYHFDPEITTTTGLVYPQQRIFHFGFSLNL